MSVRYNFGHAEPRATDRVTVWTRAAGGQWETFCRCSVSDLADTIGVIPARLDVVVNTLRGAK